MIFGTVSGTIIGTVSETASMIISGTVLTAHAEPERSTFTGFMLPETVHVSRPVD